MDISADEFISRFRADDQINIIDVREELEFQTFNMGGVNIPLGRLLSDAGELELDTDSEIVVVCQRGLRSETAKRALSQNGYINVRNLTGGLLAVRKLNP